MSSGLTLAHGLPHQSNSDALTFSMGVTCTFTGGASFMWCSNRRTDAPSSQTISAVASDGPVRRQALRRSFARNARVVLYEFCIPLPFGVDAQDGPNVTS